jgi:hypothetical protein
MFCAASVLICFFSVSSTRAILSKRITTKKQKQKYKRYSHIQVVTESQVIPEYINKKKELSFGGTLFPATL